MHKSTRVTVSAVIILLASLAGLLSSAAVLFVSFARTMEPGTARGMAILFGTPGAVSLLGIATAVGLFQRKRWARIMILLFSPFLLIGGILLLALFVYGTLQSPEQNSVVSTTAIILVLFLPMILIGQWWLFLFNHPSIKAEFDI